MESTIPHLYSEHTLDIRTIPGQIYYLKHYLTESAEDVKISLVTKGHQDIFVSANSSNKNPSGDAYDFTTKFQKGGNYSNGKSLMIPSMLLGLLNPSCKDLGYAEDGPCALWIGVNCLEVSTCSAKIEISYENHSPKRVVAGVAKHSMLSGNSFNYYYLPVSSSHITDVLAILTPLSGDADLYINL